MTEEQTAADEPPSRDCGECGEPMKHLADFRTFGERPAARVFRCHSCNNVISEPR